MGNTLSLKNSSFIVSMYALALLYAVFENFLPSFGFFDEFIAMLLFMYSVLFGGILKKKEFLFFLSIVLFYIIYSKITSVNIFRAQLRDLISITKPFLCFYAAYYMKYTLTAEHKKILSRLSLLFGVCLWGILPFINSLYANTAAFYTPCVLCAATYLVFSRKGKRDWIIALFLLIPGLFTGRSKFYTEFVIFVFVAFFWKKSIKISLKWIFVAIILAAVSIFISWTKFNIYFVSGVENGVARSLLYVKSFSVFMDYFPCGSGLGTFATDASGKYYSPLYYIYDLDKVYGLSPDNYGTDDDFFSDTFYPVLIAEFGLLGIISFILFWKARFKNISKESPGFKLFIFLLFFVLIESIASPTFVTMTMIPIMLAIGMLSSGKFQEKVKC